MHGSLQLVQKAKAWLGKGVAPAPTFHGLQKSPSVIRRIRSAMDTFTYFFKTYRIYRLVQKIFPLFLNVQP